MKNRVAYKKNVCLDRLCPVHPISSLSFDMWINSPDYVWIYWIASLTWDQYFFRSIYISENIVVVDVTIHSRFYVFFPFSACLPICYLITDVSFTIPINQFGLSIFTGYADRQHPTMWSKLLQHGVGSTPCFNPISIGGSK